jgi:hypothetical protein
VIATLVLMFAAADARLVEVSRAASTFHLSLSQGHARISFLDPSTVVVDFADASPFLAPLEKAAAEVRVVEGATEIRLITTSLAATVRRDPFHIQIEDNSGRPLVSQGVDWNSGSGHRLILGESEWLTQSPRFRLSRRAFGLFVEGTSWNNKFAATTSIRTILACNPAPKQILERMHELVPLSLDAEKWNLGFVSRPLIPQDVALLKAGLDGLVSELTDRALSREPAVGIDLARFESLESSDRDRIVGLAALLPFAYRAGFPLPPAAVALRNALTPYFRTYLQEVIERGFPLIHPLPLQFPSDPQAASARDQFLLGDEILAAPLSAGAIERKVYLPRGHWTNWESGKRYPGSQVVTIKPADPLPPLFIKSGSIVPWQLADCLQLHYFPQLGAEFFLYDELSNLTQAHAAPAGDYVRLELNSATGSYEWVVHHLRRPRTVSLGDIALPERVNPLQPGWRYDLAQRSLFIRLPSLGGQDTIVNIDFADPKERFDFE